MRSNRFVREAGRAARHACAQPDWCRCRDSDAAATSRDRRAHGRWRAEQSTDSQTSPGPAVITVRGRVASLGPALPMRLAGTAEEHLITPAGVCDGYGASTNHSTAWRLLATGGWRERRDHLAGALGAASHATSSRAARSCHTRMRAVCSRGRSTHSIHTLGQGIAALRLEPTAPTPPMNESDHEP